MAVYVPTFGAPVASYPAVPVVPNCAGRSRGRPADRSPGRASDSHCPKHGHRPQRAYPVRLTTPPASASPTEKTSTQGASATCQGSFRTALTTATG
ncbi:hypothetical protein MTO96_019721 [Rhipicephalus appendiculatus]